MRWLSILLLLAISAPALAQDGGGTLSGTARAKVKPDCGKDRLAVAWVFQSTAGSWTATVGGSASLAGTAVVAGNSGKNWNLAFDAMSKTSFDQALAAWATDLCETPVTLSQPSSITHFNLKLNKRRTRAKLTMFATGHGTTIAGAGTGKLKTILRGPWQDAP